MSIPNILPNPLLSNTTPTHPECESTPGEAEQVAAALAAATQVSWPNNVTMGRPDLASVQLVKDVLMMQYALPALTPSPEPPWHERFNDLNFINHDPTLRDLQTLLPKQPSRHPNPTIRKIEDRYNQTIALLEVKIRRFVRKLKAGFKAGMSAANKA